MPGSIVRSKTAQLVAELLGAREGRAHLSQFGWVQGMPIVMATAKERLIDVMGLASVHGRAVLIAMAQENNRELNLMHVSIPNPVLAVVQASEPEATIESFFNRLSQEKMVEFRVEYWAHSSVAHRIPPYVPDTSDEAGFYTEYLRS